MAKTEEMVAKVFPSLDYKKYLEMPWLKRNWRRRKQFWMPVMYILEHLEAMDKAKVYDPDNKWQNKKKESIRQQIKAGKGPNDFEPVLLTLHKTKHEFRVGDGISKLSVFREKRWPIIKTSVQVGTW